MVFTGIRRQLPVMAGMNSFLSEQETFSFRLRLSGQKGTKVPGNGGGKPGREDGMRGASEENREQVERIEKNSPVQPGRKDERRLLN